MRYNHFDMLPAMAFRSLGGRMTLEGGGKGSAPAAPDYAAAAQQTAAGNKETAIATQAGNMINQYTPYGSVTYAQRGETNGTPLWEQVVTLSPEQQAAYQKDVAMNASLQDVGMQGVGYVQNALNAPLQSPGQAVGTAGTTQFQTGAWIPSFDLGGAYRGAMQESVANPTIGLATGAQAGPMQMGVANNANKVDFDISNAGKINQGVYQNLGQIKTGTGANERAKTFNYNPQVQTGIANAGGINQGVYQNMGQIKTATGANQIAGGFNYNPEVQKNIAKAGNVQESVNAPSINITGRLDNAGSLAYGSPQNAGQIRTNVQDPSLVQQQVTDALYKQQTAMLDPQFAKSQKGLENQLSNQGITRGSEAWNNAMQEANLQKQQAYESARQSAIGQGVSAAQGLYSSQLAGMGAVNQALGQQYSQGVTAAQLQNQAVGQQFGQNLSAAQLQNAANAQQLQNALATGQFANQAQAQKFGQNQAAQQAYNQALAQQFSQGQSNQQLANQAAAQNNALAQANAQFANQAIGQQFAQGIQGQQAQNAAQAQQFSQNQAKQQAYNQAIAQQFSQGQSNQQLANQAAAQNNALAQANAAFANQALGQQFSQGIQGQQAQNAAQAQQFAQNQAQQQAYNQALAQQFSQGLQGAQFANTAQQQAYQQSLSNAQMQNQARAQQLQEALSKGEFKNQAQAQAYAQELQNLQQKNAAATQLFGMQQANANLANQAANQQYAQQLSNAQLYNQALQQNFANAQTLRQEPINILNAVRSGAQMQTAAQPQVGVSQPGQLANYSGPDYLGAATATGQYNQGLYNAQQASNSAMTSGLMGLGGAGMMAFAMSDRRTKENIVKIGQLDNGLNIYSFEYKPEFKSHPLAGHGKFIGVMADEVEMVKPEAVKLMDNGYKMVDYGVIYG